MSPVTWTERGRPRPTAQQRLRRFALLLGFACSLLAAPAAAQQVAVPYYGPEAFAAAFAANAQDPLASRFAASAKALVVAVEALCAAPVAAKRSAPASRQAEERKTELLLHAKQAWVAAADDWERLQSVSVGPTVERRSARSLDFRPARPALIKRAIGQHGRGKEPPGAKAFERVGAPAKGLPAIEWLLWDPEAPQTTAACRYASGVAQEVARESAALAEAHGADAARDWKEEAEAAAGRAAEVVNQWLAGLEVLRWRDMGKPLAMLASKRGDAASPQSNPDIWPRAPSSSHRQAWQARWEALRAIAIGPAPTDGFGAQPAVAPAVVSFEAMLRGRGRNPEADLWAKSVMTADQAMQSLTGQADVLSSPPAAAPPVASGQEAALLPPPAVLPPADDLAAAVKALDAVKQYMQETVAPALKVTLGFSDADGD